MLNCGPKNSRAIPDKILPISPSLSRVSSISSRVVLEPSAMSKKVFFVLLDIQITLH